MSERFLSNVDRALYLGAMPGFAGLDPERLEQVAAAASERFVRRGEALSRQGEPVLSTWIVVEGELLARGEGVGERRIGARQGVGLLSVLARSASGLELSALRDSHLLVYHAEDIRDAYEEDFSLLVHQLRLVAGRVLELRRRTPTGTLLSRPEVSLPPGQALDLVERIRLLRSTAFGSAGLEALADLASSLEEVRLTPDTRLWQTGDPAGIVYLLLSGTVRCVTDDGWFRAGAGYPLGNVESLCGKPRWFEPITESPVVALRGESEGVLDILEDHFEMAMDMLSSMSANLLGLMDEDRAR